MMCGWLAIVVVGIGPAGIRAWLVAFQYAEAVLLATRSPSILRVDRTPPGPEQHAFPHPCRSINSIQFVAGVDYSNGIHGQGRDLPVKARTHHCALRRGGNC